MLEEIQEWLEDRKEAREKEFVEVLKLDVEAFINIMEFNGEKYISYNGHPLVPIQDLKKPDIEVLGHAREAYVSHKLKFRNA